LAQRTSPRPRHLQVTAYWYLDEVITCWQSAPRTWPRRKVGDITRAAFVLTHFEHSYIT
jgi:hypothetical protein